MESPRSAKRRKLETIPESPGPANHKTTAAPPTASTGKTSTTTSTTDKDDARDTIRVASVATPSSLNLTPSKPTPRPAPMSAGRGIGGLMARLNAKIAEQQSPRKSPVKNGTEGTPVATKKPELQELEKSAKVKTLSQKLRDTFEQEQLERAAKRRPKLRNPGDGNGIESQGQRSLSASPVKLQPPPTSEKRRPGRPRKIVQELILDTTAEDDEGPVSPSKLASSRKPQQRHVSPMKLERPQFTPRKAIASPLKPRTMIDLDVKPLQTNASANLDMSTADLQAIQSAVLHQLQGRTHTAFVGLEEEHAKIAALVHQTIVAGESNSMLVIGARGSGKTAVVESILREQARENPDLFHIVRLNAFIHTDDKIALKDIWRQLGKDMDLEDSEQSKNYADTLTTLLALLSHPEELGRSAEQMTKSVVFVLDEFDLFTTHPRQTLLYNLFDIAQSRKAPIAVLGLTTRFDVVEQLEKRVKSRFSHRYVHLSLSKDLSSFRHICQNAMTPADNMGEISDEGRKTWYAVLNDLFTLDTFNTHLRQSYYLSKSIRGFQTSMLLAVSTLPTSSSANISAQDLLTHLADSTSLNTLQPPDSKLSALASLSQLQLALLISAARLTIVHDTENVTFPLCYAEYVSLASKAKIAASASGQFAHGAGIGRVWGKDVARGAWEGLGRKKLIMEEGKGDSCRVDVRLEEIGDAEVELGAVMTKWCREI
ncbi:hypothetical protein AUEXF2481DRAFT_2088 [Aureobasidium subglaciale EXF-2481]|uniref:Uncharacterized protein n=1 Tax=Aureobasidium subglaciale (strain EXF-2481) TaxID=1043005 RepID=A0A074YVE0_AURSE|nr:uncharacterized protein AUEXF2481DRAFT_2088 [Aureobasidium subglaciale EXF-2481]KAI5200867.1 hypothetical protein E4T38_06320 [Aureobasidium subglaciale]KAI5219518.1 hypothetical protein E4T40_06428 [Aureobasidium subglaciale]KAI5223260.1 hypothetical protein E4T41_06268 [Aureobasidium subglaciale]KAI5252689.1 hypothetical protein E4T46_09850 [Aureobasidium subglaciale]KEQ98107.1 hypothetical protein AUEXF2481DRAFT_2088 [Aureobasidium subglaciale EXF-2481]